MVLLPLNSSVISVAFVIRLSLISIPIIFSTPVYFAIRAQNCPEPQPMSNIDFLLATKPIKSLNGQIKGLYLIFILSTNLALVVLEVKNFMISEFVILPHINN